MMMEMEQFITISTILLPLGGFEYGSDSLSFRHKVTQELKHEQESLT